MKKEKIAFIVDSSIGLYGSDIESENTKQVYFNVTNSKHENFLDDNSKLNLNYIFDSLSEGISFKTSAVSPGSVMVAIEELLEKKYEKIILLTISSGLSSFYDNIKFLEEEFKEQFYVVDTKEVGYAIKIILDNAKQMVENGCSITEILDYCSNFYKNDFTSFTCENWDSLANGGRAPKLLSKVLSTMHTRPVINFYIKNKLGGIVLGKGEKGFHKAFEKMIENFKKSFANTTKSSIDYIVFYNNNIKESRATYIKDKLCEIFEITKNKIIETFTPNLVLIYTGNESFGIHIRNKEEANHRE